MDDGFALLEEKVHKAADLVTRLRKENKLLSEAGDKAKAALQEAEKRLAALQKEKAASAEQSQAADALKKEVEQLKHERTEVRNRIGKLVELLEGLD
jgi:predicted RNase H-like nuclease (RuvC/YqgF family)